MPGALGLTHAAHAAAAYLQVVVGGGEAIEGLLQVADDKALVVLARAAQRDDERALPLALDIAVAATENGINIRPLSVRHPGHRGNPMRACMHSAYPNAAQLLQGPPGCPWCPCH